VTKSAVIADDDETIRSILQHKLSSAGFELTVCHDGEECRQVLNDPSVSPDIVILDVMMPRMKGTQLLRTIRRGELAVDATIPVVMLTSRGQEADILEGLEAGADEYLTKPFSPSELLMRVNRLVEG
jgi:DNA-binding response OmpR family regulator